MTQQASLPLDIAPAKPQPEPDREDEEKRRALEGLPHYWRISWGYYDVVVEPCGYPAHIPVERLEDPAYKPVRVCPWKGTKHDHKPFWEKWPTGWTYEP